MTGSGQGAHCEQQEIAVGWALHALEPGEEAAFRTHLPHCERCQATVRDTEEVGAALALGVNQVEPSAAMRERIDRLTGEVIAAPQPVRSLADARSERSASRRPALLVAAAVLLVALSVGLGVRTVQLDADRDVAAQQAAAASEVIALASDPATRTIELAATDGRPLARLLAGPDSHVLMPLALPANRTDQTYVLWGLRPGDAVALDTFDVPADEPAMRIVGSGPGTVPFVGYAVSLEPGRTMPPAPSEVLASGQVES